MSADDRATRSAAICPACGAQLPPTGQACSHCAATAGSETEPPAAFTGPKRIASYVLLREVGSGGMGTVFEAFDEAMQRKVALKVLSRHHAPSDRADRRFAQEAWIAGKLSHPNVVKVYERGTWEELSYFSMELVDGGSLAEVVSNMRRWGRDDRLGLEFDSPEYVRWAIEQVRTAARGLDYAHRGGVVHRDVKPMNLLLDGETGSLKIADFGLAIDAESARMTSAGKLLGTPLYMAPEQVLGRPGEIDARTDVYALGVTLFELLTLELPYVGTTQQLYFNAVLTSAARSARGMNRRVSADLETVIRKALEKAPRDRYATAADLAADLTNVLELRPIHAVAPGRLERLWKWARRKPVHATLAGVLVAGLPMTAFLTQRAIAERRLALRAQLVELVQHMRVLDQRGDNRGLLEVTSEILALDPANTRAWRTRSLSAMYLTLEERTRAPEEAAGFERRAIDDAARLVEANPQASWAYQFQGFVLAQLGREEEAQRARDLAEVRDREAPAQQDHHLEARNAMDRGDLDRAVELLSGVIARHPDYRGALDDRARAYERLGRVEEAMQDYRVVAALDPNDLLTRYNLGILLTRTGRYEEGGRYLDRASELGADGFVGLSDNRLEGGRRAAYDGRPEQALERFREAESAARSGLALDPGLALLHLNLGASLMEQHRIEGVRDDERVAEAASHYTEALRVWSDARKPDDLRGQGTALMNLCDLLLQSASPERALAVCTEATERLPGNAAAFYNLAAVHARMGQPEEALAALERDLELGDRDWRYLADDAWFASLREDARFGAIVERMRRDVAEQPKK